MASSRACLVAVAALVAGVTVAAAPRYRPAVKALSDRAADSIDWEPRLVTVRELAQAPRCRASATSARGASMREFYVWEVRAVVLERRTERDGDYHLILADPADPGTTLVAEVPDPRYVPSGHRGEVAGARRVAKRLKRGACVRVRGPAFCDFPHNARGQAPSSLEIHPCIFMREVACQS